MRIRKPPLDSSGLDGTNIAWNLQMVSAPAKMYLFIRELTNIVKTG